MAIKMNTTFTDDNCYALHLFIIIGHHEEVKNELNGINFYELAIFYTWLIRTGVTDNPIKYLNKYVINQD